MLHPVFKAARPSLYGVGCRRSWVDPHPAVGDRDWEGPHVVGEGVEGAAAGEVEPGMMPVAGEDSVADGASVEGETHVGASVIDGGEAVSEGKDGDGVPTSGDYRTSTVPHFFYCSGVEQALGCCGYRTPPDGLLWREFSCQDSTEHQGVMNSGCSGNNGMPRSPSYPTGVTGLATSSRHGRSRSPTGELASQIRSHFLMNMVL